MNSDMTFTITTSDSAVTEALGQRLAQNLQGNELLELIGDLGSGKTTLARGILRGLGYEGPVTSPTFTVVRTYSLPGGMRVEHVDLYRLGEDQLMQQMLLESVAEPQTMVLAEWATPDRTALPPERIQVKLQPGKHPDARHIKIDAPKSLAYVLKGIS